MKVVVTGGSGKAGRAVVRDLVERGYDVLNVDLVAPKERLCPYLQANLTHLGETFEVLRDANAVIHLAAIPAPGIATEEVTFRTNVESTFNVLMAATSLRFERIIWASSEKTLGVPFEKVQPAYAPIDENHPLLPESTYALSKVIGEELARQFNRRTGIPIVGLRFSNIMEPEDYAAFPTYWEDSALRKWNLWAYVDARDVAQSCRLALERPVAGAPFFIIAAADTVMNRPSRELMAEAFPTVKLVNRLEEFETLLSIERARKILGYEPRFSWRSQS